MSQHRDCNTNTELIARLRETYPATYCFTDIPHIAIEAADAIEALEAQADTLRYEFDAAAAIKAERDALQAQLAAAQTESERLKSGWQQSVQCYVETVGQRDAFQKDAEQWRAYKARKDAVIAAGMGKNPLRAAPIPQPVQQVNAMLVEALGQAEKLEHEALVALSEATHELKVGNTYTTATDTYKANNDLIHRLDKILNLQYRDRKHAALTASPETT